jgi:hypothetical protein
MNTNDATRLNTLTLTDTELEQVVAGKGLVKEIDVRFQRQAVRAVGVSVVRPVSGGTGKCAGGQCPI